MMYSDPTDRAAKTFWRTPPTAPPGSAIAMGRVTAVRGQGEVAPQRPPGAGPAEVDRVADLEGADDRPRVVGGDHLPALDVRDEVPHLPQPLARGVPRPLEDRGS